MAIVLAGCASSLSGLGSTESYACKAPVGAQCTSVSGNYANSSADTGANSGANANPFATRAMHETQRPPQGLLATESVPATLRKTRPSAPADASPGPASSTPAGAAASTSVNVAASRAAAKLRSSPRVLRLWVAPWEDRDGDLHDASFVHVVIDTGRWLIDRVRPAPSSKLDVTTPPLVPPSAPDPAPDARSAADPSPTEP
ncbi:type IV conjugative transfer system lipoprotein TraV [Candidatus Skiveiella danica]|uniref:type IV conjugative transfer system lipoprotein TraV n=1 Tax=Candidatus Skiveiella danica TaxID=3386177 RepID=UPI0039B912DC